MINTQNPWELILKAIRKRPLVNHSTNAYRLFNGFYEGLPGLVLDRYGSALVIFDHSETCEFKHMINEVKQWAISNLSGLEAVLHKQRQHPEAQMKQGCLLFGSQSPEEINELGVTYAIDLQLHQDASFYLDTRHLRQWLLRNMLEKRVLNTFAYTGSLGTAAGVGGASVVVQTDLNKNYLHIAQRSWALNQLPAEKHHTISGDFFRVIGRMRNQERLFDCVILDPPFFSTTGAGKVDLQNETTRLINKVRPLVAHAGWLVVINNALFLSGADFMAELESLCSSGHLNIERTITIPIDVTGYPDTIITPPPADPAPFNHPTKIAILKVFRKDSRK
jgi:23S rRNA (cytosine1962-C5)-methyltransferase